MKVIKLENNKVAKFSTDGTCLMGKLDVSYNKLVETFGQPNGDEFVKIDAQWVILTDCGIATIYNYKNGKSYLGERGLEVEEIRDWHIGGKDKSVVTCIKEALKD